MIRRYRGPTRPNTPDDIRDRNVFLFLVALVIGILVMLTAWIGRSQSGMVTATNIDANYYYMVTNIWRNKGTNILTITNRAWLQFEGVAIVRVTDSEWATLTNHYPDPCLIV